MWGRGSGPPLNEPPRPLCPPSQQLDGLLGKSERQRADMFGELLQAANTSGDLRSCPVRLRPPSVPLHGGTHSPTHWESSAYGLFGSFAGLKDAAVCRNPHADTDLFPNSH